jgi:hypothetical protein
MVRQIIPVRVETDTLAPGSHRHGGRRPAIHAFGQAAKGMDADLRRHDGVAAGRESAPTRIGINPVFYQSRAGPFRLAIRSIGFA